MVSSRTSSSNVTSTANAGSASDGVASSSSRDDESRATTNGVIVGQEWSQSGPPSLSMSVDLHNLVSSNLSDSGRYSASPDQAATTGAATIKIGCHDEEESYEGFGSVEGDSVGDDGLESPGGSSSASPTGTGSRRNPRSPNSTVGRHSWLRTSLRRTPPCSARKRLSTNALASQLYRSGSFNSSGMGTNYDATDDVYSDVSLEDMMDLSHKTARTRQDAAQNCPAEFLRCAERNGDDGRPREDRGEASSPTGTKKFADLTRGHDDDREENGDDRNESEDGESSCLHNYGRRDEREDARFRRIKCPSIQLRDIAVGTGVHVTKYDRHV